MRHLSSTLTLLAALLAAAPASADAGAVPAAAVSVGLTRIDLPAPDGFVEPNRDAPALLQLGERMTPTTNRLLAIFVAESDLRLARAGQPPAMQRYFMAQTLRQAESATVSASDFAPIKAQLRQHFQSLLGQVSPSVQEQLDRVSRDIGRDAGVEGFSLKVGELKGLEVFDERAQSISLLALTRYAVQAHGQEQTLLMAMSLTTAVLKGKLTYFYAYSAYRGPEDLDWLRNATRAWLPRAEQANQVQ